MAETAGSEGQSLAAGAYTVSDMERRLAAALILAALAVGGLPAFLFVRDRGDDDDALARMSTPQRPFEMPIPNPLGAPNSPKPTGEAFFIAERNGVRLIRLPRKDGTSCWGTSDRRFGEWQLTYFSCETTFSRFPDPKAPVLLLSRGGFIPQTQFREYESFQGLAADGVARVGVVDARDRDVPLARVQHNAFWAQTPSDRVKGVVAFDGEGKVIWRSPPVEWPVD